MNGIESVLYEVSKLFLVPVLVALSCMFIYALFVFGMLLFELASRAAFGRASEPLHRFAERNPAATQDDLELQVLKTLEPLRLVSRIAPMLGLVATMIPMGPALIAVSAGNAAGMAESLVVAFSAVIVALLAAAMTYAALCVRRRWLLMEINAILNRSAGARAQAAPEPTSGVPLAGGAHG